MKAPEIKHYINWLGRVEYRNINCSFTYDETSYAAIDRIFRLLHRLEPGPENTSWELWLRAERGTIEDFGSFEELRADGQVESFEEFETWWHSEFPEEAAWFHFAAGEDQEIGYRAIFLGHRHVLEVDGRRERSFPQRHLQIHRLAGGGGTGHRSDGGNRFLSGTGGTGAAHLASNRNHPAPGSVEGIPTVEGGVLPGLLPAGGGGVSHLGGGVSFGK